MKTKNIIFNLVVIIGLITPFFFVVTPVIGQDSDFETRQTIQISEGTNISVTAAAPLRWTLGELTNLTVNIRLLALDDTYLNIILLSAAYNIPDEPFPISQPQQTIETKLNNSFTNVTNIQSLTAPENADEFNITITIIAQLANMSESSSYEMEFPGEGVEDIAIRRRIVLPIIKLPGFPNAETFIRWIIIFVVILVVITLPASFVASFKLKEYLDQRKKGKGRKKEENKNE